MSNFIWNVYLDGGLDYDDLVEDEDPIDYEGDEDFIWDENDDLEEIILK